LLPGPRLPWALSSPSVGSSLGSSEGSSLGDSLGLGDSDGVGDCVSSGPEETTIVMSEPLATDSFAPGSVRITWFSGTESEAAVVVVRPNTASRRVVGASSTGGPLTFGAVTGPGSAALTGVTLEP